LAASGYAVNRTQWNRLAERFNSSVCDIVAGERGKVIPSLVREALRRRPKPVVVDLGCGVGTFIHRFGAKFGETVGVDFAERMLVGARRRCRQVPRVRWVCASVEQAPARVGEIADLSVCLNVLTAPDAALRRKQWKSLAAITTPGGCTLVVLPSIESAQFVARVEEELRRRTASAAGAGPDGEVFRGKARQKHYTRQELGEAAERAGFRVVRISRVYYPWADEGIHTRTAATRGRYPWDWALLGVKRTR
jgi:SAM-dependent methyltransferase